MKKRMPRKGYRVLAVVWTLAASSMAVAFVRYLPVEFNLFLLMMTALSMLTAAISSRNRLNSTGRYRTNATAMEAAASVQTTASTR